MSNLITSTSTYTTLMSLGFDREMLREQAAFWQGGLFAPDDPRGQPADAYIWSEIPTYPLRQIEARDHDWLAWFAEEVAMWAEIGQPERYVDMVTGPIREAVVLVEHDGRAWLWDGWHRTAASHVAGRCTIPALVGRAR